jgi:predicted alpha/beta-fold hydrolase
MQLNSNFSPPLLLRNCHLMTLLPAIITRGHRLKAHPAEIVTIPVSSDSSITAHCHIQPDQSKTPTLLLVHGLEGSSESSYIVGLAEQALAAGTNVVRINLRNCGNTLHLTPTLYNAGLSEDIIQGVDWLNRERQLNNFSLVGYSLGGNLVLKTAAELGKSSSAVSSICAISPSIDLEAAVTALGQGFNRIYEYNFLMSLKDKIKKKQKLYPDHYDLRKLVQVKSLKQFDETYTAPDGGYKNAEDYYRQASALFVLKNIRLPTLIIAAQDDPLVPFESFHGIETRYISLLAPKYGGHAAFIQRRQKKSDGKPIEEIFWTDHRVISFCLENTNNA